MLLISSLRSRILLLLLAVVLPMFCIVSYSFYEQRQNMVRTLEHEMTTDVRILAGVMAQKVDGARGLLSALAYSPSIYNRDSVGCNELLAHIFKDNPQYTNLGAADLDGNAFCSALPMTKPVNFSDRTWFQRTVKSPDIVFGNYVLGRIVDKPVMIIAHAARSKSGEVQAAILVPFDLDQLAKIPEQIKRPWNIEFFILDRNGTILAHDPDQDKWVGKTAGESSLITTILTRHTGLMETKGVDGITRFYAFIPVTGTDNSIFVSIGVSRDVYLADTNRIFIRNLMILSVIIVLSFAVAILISRLAAQAEEKFVAGAEQFRDLYDNAPNGYLSFGTDGLIKRCNKRMSELLGSEPERLLGLHVVHLYADVPDGKEKANKLFQRFLSGETILEEEIQLRKSDGMTVWMSLSMNAVLDAQGQVLEGRAIIQDITERKQVEELLHKSSEEIEDLYQHAPCGYHSLDKDGIIHRINDTELAWLGYTRDEVVGKLKWIDLITPASQQVFWNNYSTFKQQGFISDLEFEMLRKDGTKFTVLLNSSAIYDSNGDYATSRSTIFDITERKRNETHVQQLGQLLKSSFNEIYLFDAHTLHFLQTSDGAQKNLGYSADELAQLTPLDLKPEFTRESFEALLVPLRSGEKQKLSFETIHRRKDGTTYPITFRLQLMQSDAPLFVGIAQDITEHKQHLAQLVTAKEQWEKTFDAMPEIITIQDKDMRIVRANKAAHQLFPVELGELNGKHCYEVFTGVSAPCPGCPVVETLQDRKEHSAIISHENLGKIFDVSSATVTADNGEIEHIVHVAKDITELKQMEEHLRQAQKMEAIGTLAGGIAHDFNNILSPILGYSEMVAERLPEGSQEREMVLDIRTAGKRATELVKQILTFSRQSEQQRQPLQIHLVIKEALKLLRSSIPTTIAIHQNVVDCGLVMADPTQVHQIIMNLCTNAYHAMRETGGELDVSMEVVELTTQDSLDSLALQPGPHVKLSVRDTGCGMSKELQERIFEPYFTTKKKSEGTGLGLSVVHGIVESHHGHITVYSEPGKGTEFHVYLPQVQGHDEGLAKEAAGEIPRGSGTILVVDDEPIIGEMLKRMLSNIGYEVLLCSSSTEALAVFTQQRARIALVLTDMTMPVMNGGELARRIKQLSPAMPVVLCSGFSEIMNEEKARLMGIDGYMMKPVIQRQLAQTLHDILEKKGGSGPAV